METTPLTCTICIKKYNKKSIKIQCDKCAFEACYGCYKQYLTNRQVGHRSKITCMNCREIWSDYFVFSHFPKSFSKCLQTWRLEELMQEEMALMPQTQKKLEYLNKYEHVMNNIRYFDDEIGKLMQQIRKIKILKNVAVAEIGKLEGEFMKLTRTQDTKPCSNNQCRGFLNREWICGLCQTQTCKECLCEMAENHVCQPENIQSTLAILKDTKPCPKCTIPIIKSEGCDQIWCIHCNTAFNWHTHKIIIFTDSFHNPHYSEWYKKTMESRHMLDDSMDIFLPIFNDKYKKLIQESFNRSFYLDDSFLKIKLNFGLIIQSYKEMVKRQSNVIHAQSFNENIRLEYLKNHIDLNSFQTLIQKRMKTFWTQNEKNRVFQKSIAQGKQIIYEYYQHIFQLLNVIPKKRLRSVVQREQLELYTQTIHLYDSFEQKIRDSLTRHNQELDEIYQINKIKKTFYFHFIPNTTKITFSQSPETASILQNMAQNLVPIGL